jgi:drug/metabolite transporter (DMT)-like permease
VTAAAAAALPRPNALAGIALVLAACACFSALDTATKYVSTAVPLLMALWVRYCFQAVATTVVVVPMRGLAVFRTRKLAWQLVRGLLLLTSSLLSFASLRYLPVGEFTAIVMITPLVITLLSARLLQEQVGALRWALVAGGFAGTLLIIRPGGQAFGWASLLPLALVASNASFQVLTSKLARTEDPVTMHLYTGWAGPLAVGGPGLHGIDGVGRPLPADPRLLPGPGGHLDALPVQPDRLRHAWRPTGFFACAGQAFAGRHRHDRGLRRRRRLADGARAPRGRLTLRPWPNTSKSTPRTRSRAF